MASADNLIGAGIPDAAARLVGFTASSKSGVGTAQSGATPITSNLTVGTTAGGQTAFLLPVSKVSTGPLVFFNNTATAALVFPQSGEQINNGGANASFSVAQNKTAMFFKISATAWAASLSA